MQARSSIYINLDDIKGEPRTQIQILTGAIGSKASKIAGSPTVNVVTSSAVMAVRGTEYEVVVSINANDDGDSQQATLVTCTESKVAVNDGQEEVEVPAGKVLEKRPGREAPLHPGGRSPPSRTIQPAMDRRRDRGLQGRRAPRPRRATPSATPISQPSSPPRSIPSRNPPRPRNGPTRTAREPRSDPLDPAVLREKKEIAGYLLNIRKVLFIFERIYYRVDEISDVIAGTPNEKRQIKPGLTAADFLKQVKADRDKLADEVARYRYIEALYIERNPDGRRLLERRRLLRLPRRILMPRSASLAGARRRTAAIVRGYRPRDSRDVRPRPRGLAAAGSRRYPRRRG